MPTRGRVREEMRVANGIRTGTRLRAAVAAGAVAALLAGTMGTAPAAMANPDDELIWEEGTITSIADGDTLVATLDTGSGARGSQRIRTIGVQAPEVAHNGTPPECGAAQATTRLRDQLPTGSRVQTRSVDVNSYDDYSGGRIVRSLYAQDQESNWYDTSRGTVSDGWLMWFPLSAASNNKAEWAHNLEYRVLADDAAGQGRGLWAANLCGAAPYAGANLRVWAKYWGTEEVYVENLSGFDVDLSGWTIRDSAISGYRTLAAGTVVPAGGVRKVYSGDLNLNNLPADNAAFEGDAVFLLDNTGSLATGNLRAWFPYPCNPDNCGDVLTGGISMSAPFLSSPPVRKPSNPGSVTAQATTDGSGNVTVTWAAPNDFGGPTISYTITPSSTDGGSVPAAATGVTETSYTFPGLTLGKSYRFAVRAVGAGGLSDSIQSTPAVSPAGPPGAPTSIVTEARSSAAVISWTAGASGGIDADTVTYTATAVNDPTRMCTASGATSCVVPGLANGTPYTFTVRANNGLAAADSAASAPVTPLDYLPSGTAAPGVPKDVTATAGNGKAVVSWARPDSDGGQQITSYTATSGPRSCIASGGATSCVVPGLTNGTPYTFTVRANNGADGPTASSASVTPFASGSVRTSTTTAAPPAADPWIGGQYIELTNTSASTARLGGYGLWNAQSSRFDNNGRLENRAAFLFDAAETLGAGQTLRVYFASAPPSVGQTGGGVKSIFAGANLALNTDSDFVELANLNGAQIACRSKAGSSCVRAQVASVPSSPVGVTARSTASDVTVTWGAPISRGGLAIAGYSATAYDAPVGGNIIASCAAGGADRSCSFPATLGSAYYVDVVATNAQGSSGPSWRVRAVPKTVPSAPGNVTVSGTPGGVNVTWTPAVENGATITKYTASAYTAGTGGNPVGTCTTSNGSLTGCTIMKLQGGTQYYIDVMATNRAGNGAASSPRAPGTPGPGGAVSTYSKGKVTVRWDAPTPGSNTITGYTARLYTKSKGGTKVGECSAPAGKTSCTTKKMKKRSKYYIDLTMQSAAGTFTVKPRIVTGPPKKASAPKVTSATPTGKQVTIAWAPPSFNGYSYLKGYGARLYSKKKGGSVKASCSAGPAATTCTTKAVKKKGTYYSAVRVKNSKGWSKWSKRVKVVVR
jgi:fibronectin type 3 domain-containing protein